MGSCCSCCGCCQNPNAEYTNPDYVQARRKILSKEKVSCPKNTDIHEEYVELEDGNVIFTRCYIPNDRKPIGMICYNHGYADHLNLFIHDIGIEFTSKRDYIFFTFEHYGHGRSDGLWIYCNNFDKYIKESIYIFNWAKIKYGKNLFNLPNNSYFIGGESMGGAITIQQIIKQSQPSYQNLSNINTFKNSSNLSNEALRLNSSDDENENENNNEENNDNSIPEWNGMFLIAPMCMVDPNVRPPKCIELIFRYICVSMAPKAKIAPAAKIDKWFFSPKAPKESQESWDNNPLWYDHDPRLITAKEILDATDFIEDNTSKIEIPYIILHGKDDKVTDPAFSKKFYENSSSKDKTLKMYDDAWHVLTHDYCRDQLFKDISTWMEERINKNEINDKQSDQQQNEEEKMDN